jgi:tRNA(Ile)-lysidine synthetase-like protein
LRALGREVGCTIGSRGARRLARFARSGTSGKTLELGRGFDAVLAFDRLAVERRPREAPPTGATIQGRQGMLAWGQWVFAWRTQAAGPVTRSGYSTWVCPGGLTLRAVGVGDRLVPLGGVGSRKVRRILMESRVPFRARATHPVLEQDGAILWVPGVCRSNVAVPDAGREALLIEARQQGGRDGTARE